MEPPTEAQKRQKLMEIYLKTHLVSSQFAEFSIGRMSDADVDEKLAFYTQQNDR